MRTFLILSFIVILTLLGDYCIKIASGKPEGLLSKYFYFGALLYAIPAVGWFFLMKSHSLAVIGVLYSVSLIVMLALLGVVIFKEAIGLREVAGLTLAILAVVIIGQK